MEDLSLAFSCFLSLEHSLELLILNSKCIRLKNLTLKYPNKYRTVDFILRHFRIVGVCNKIQFKSVHIGWLRMWHASYFMCRLVSPPLWSRTSTPSSPLLLLSSTLTSSATSLSSYRRSCLSSFGFFHLYELFLTVTVFSELGGGEWSRETEASESDWTDRQGGSLWGNHRKSMRRSYVYMKLCISVSWLKLNWKLGFELD